MEAPLPYPSPDNSDDIITFIEYVKRNGSVFEEKVKTKEAGNLKFSFLFPDKNEGGYRYYKWRLYLAVNNYDVDDIINIEEKYKEKIRNINPGFIKLTNEDTTLLLSLLSQNTGSKDSIRAIRKWIIDRNHSLACIINVICSLYLGPLVNSNDINFNKCLFVVYIVNDVLFNSTSVVDGIYTKILNLSDSSSQKIDIVKILFPYIPWLLQTSYRCSSNDNEKDRILKMITLWVNKGYIDNNLGEEITKIIKDSSSTCQIPPAFNLISPSVIEPLPIPQAATLQIQNFGYHPQPTGFVMPQLHQSNFTILQQPQIPTLLPMMDISKITVGTMTDIVKSATKRGHPRYQPLDISSLSNMAPVHVEPGRLDIRVNDFYKKYDAIK